MNIAEAAQSAIRRWRWRVARWVAPVAIEADPYPGEDGFAYIVTRGEGFAGGRGYTVTVRAASLEMTITNTLASFDEALPLYRPSGRTGTFSGTIAP